MRKRTLLAGTLGAVLVAASGGACADAPPSDLLALSLEELGDLPVISASRRTDRLADTPASVHVIHGDELRALGIRSLAEALRLAPTLHVARVNARGYAISARGFTTTLSNKMLVMIDGRPIYTPLFAGVLWDAQDPLVEEIERIEIVSGPGASVWGSNAVNGVINVITRPALPIAAGHALGWAGEEGHGWAVRQQWPLGETAAMRTWAKRSISDATAARGGGEVSDGWTQQQAGFRADWQVGADPLRLQGEAFDAQSSPRAFGAIEVDGGYLLGEWLHPTVDGDELRLQAYVDRMNRHDPLVLSDRLQIAALDFQHARAIGIRQLAWGGGYRRADDRSTPGAFARLVPADRVLTWAHLFAEQRWPIGDSVAVDLGLRLERNPYTGIEWLPSARFAWSDDPSRMLWGALSRTVRTPARIDRDFRFPAEPPFLIRGGPDFESEVSNVAELGLRLQPTPVLMLSLTGFHAWHDDLRSGRPAADFGAFIVNDADGRTYGLEGWAHLRAVDAWELGVGFLELRQRLEPGDGDPAGVRELGNDPRHQAIVRLIRQLGPTQRFALAARHVGALPDPYVPSYTAVDMRWSWLPTARLELGIALRNALDDRHAEFQPAAGLRQSEFGRSVAVDLRIDW